MAGNASTPGASVTSRALAVLFAFDDQHRRLTVTEIARRVDMPVPTAHRLVKELVAGGALVRRPDGAHVVGRRMWHLGLLAPLESGLRDIASPFLSDVHAATLATVTLAVRDGRHALYLERLSGNRSVPIISTVGTRLPLSTSGVGKVLLAHAPAAVQEEVLAGGLPRLTPHSITQPGILADQLAAVRDDGYATTVEEMTLGACSLAVPVRAGGADGTVVAALGVVVPDLRRDRPRLLTALHVAARGIGRNLP
jgi:DNA-binding IclR family transcriptional regulator